MRFHRVGLRSRFYLSVIGAALVGAAGQGAVRGALAGRETVTYYSLPLILGLFPLSIGLFGLIPDFPEYKASKKVDAEVAINILMAMFCMGTIVVPAIYFDSWIEDQGYDKEYVPRSERSYFEPDVFHKVHPEPVAPAPAPVAPQPKREIIATYDRAVEGPPTPEKVREVMKRRNSVGVTFENVSEAELKKYCASARKDPQDTILLGCPE